jgi:hypothetical protein
MRQGDAPSHPEDHQHAIDALVSGEQLAGGDRLHRLAESHLIGEQSPFTERQMQHAFALVRQQRMPQQVERAGVRVGLGQERGTRLAGSVSGAPSVSRWGRSQLRAVCVGASPAQGT